MTEQTDNPTPSHRFVLYRGRRGSVFFWGSLCLLGLLWAGLYVGERRNVGKEGSITGAPAPGHTTRFSKTDFVDAFMDPSLTKSLAHLPEKDRDRFWEESQASGRVFGVLRGTKVLIVDHKFLAQMDKVRFLDGHYSGQTGWVFEDDLSYNR